MTASPETHARSWQAVPMVTRETRAAGFLGGEGGQWPRDLAVSAADPRFMMMATDVGGIYRSLVGGGYWQVCLPGWNARGGNAFALDPKNPDRLLGVGGNSMDWNPGWGKTPHGVYLSTNRGASWKQVLPRGEGNDDRDSLAYDPSSYDPKRGYCTVAYYLSRDDGLFKSTDGGETWHEVNPSRAIGGATLAVHPTNGIVYLAGEGEKNAGFSRSADGGRTFTQVLSEPVFGLDVVASQPDHVYVSRKGGVFLSTDAGKTFRKLGSKGLPAEFPIRNVTVSPADPRRMTCWYDAGNWNWVRLYSHDGGETWKPSDFGNNVGGDYRKAKHAFLPYNVRNGIWAWHPKDPKVVFGIGGDWITRSTDGGAHFAWNNNGENAVMVGASFNFSVHHPEAIFLSFQDYNGASSWNGGRTWRYHDVSGHGWGGHEYGGFALNENVMWSGDAESWGGPRRLKITFDGGKSWTLAQHEGKEIAWAGAHVSYGDPSDSNVAFASNWRTADGGRTWTPMPDCDGVFTHNTRGAKELYGRKGDRIVKSGDRGASWTSVAEVPGGFKDLAYDPVRNRFWVASGDRLKRVKNGTVTVVEIPKDQYGAVRVATVAVDPADPSLVYAGNHKDIYACTNAVVRSTDGGRTWENLTVTAPLSNAKQPGGPHEVQWLRVHPETRELWAAGQCYGVWKIAPPKTAPAKAASPKRR